MKLLLGERSTDGTSNPGDQNEVENDKFRRAGPNVAGQNMWVVSWGVLARGSAFVDDAVGAVCAADTLVAGGDPRSQDRLALPGSEVVWRIDCYDAAFNLIPEGQTHPRARHRVLVIALASERA